MQASKPTAGSAPPSPDEMKSKINDLIAGEVSSGKLTSAQGDELKNVFANTFKGGPGGRAARVGQAVRARRIAMAIRMAGRVRPVPRAARRAIRPLQAAVGFLEFDQKFPEQQLDLRVERRLVGISASIVHR